MISPLDDVALVSPSKNAEMIALDDALKRLAEVDPRKSDVVEMRYFGGLTFEETAEALKVSRLTVIRDWNFARAWLLTELKRYNASAVVDLDLKSRSRTRRTS
jgi:RNA polymerase sigma factor (TIGR02999 family)